MSRVGAAGRGAGLAGGADGVAVLVGAALGAEGAADAEGVAVPVGEGDAEGAAVTGAEAAEAGGGALGASCTTVGRWSSWVAHPTARSRTAPAAAPARAVRLRTVLHPCAATPVPPLPAARPPVGGRP
ncbi:hypothetical protein AB0E16_19170 [Streptomyces sp. NPDC047970]|uniref:hypothetical protein n=1 Tax=Streptomyces sp. NPDC047970 TaxID=3155481 RepID=UPI00341F13FA